MTCFLEPELELLVFWQVSKQLREAVRDSDAEQIEACLWEMRGMMEHTESRRMRETIADIILETETAPKAEVS